MSQDYNTDPVVIPGGLTSIVQPLDVCINKPSKDSFRKKYSDWMTFGEHTYTPVGKIRKHSVQNILYWIDQSWQKIDAADVQKSLKKCGISNNMDGTEDDLLWESSASKSSDDSIHSDSSDSIESLCWHDD